MARLRLTLVFGLLLPSGLAAGQSGDSVQLPSGERPIRWSVTAPARPLRVRAGDRVTATVTARIADGWKLYSLTQPDGGPTATSLRVAPPFRLAGRIAAPEPESYPDRNFGIFSEIYEAGARFRLPLRLAAGTSAGDATLRVLVRYQTCTERYCLPPRTDTLSLAATVLPAEIALESTEGSAGASAAADTAAIVPVATRPARALPPERFTAPADLASLAHFLWLAATMGLLALLTPCILPMIPITVGFFGKDAAPSTAVPRARTGVALAHAAGIVATFTGLGLLVSAAYGAGGLVRLAAHPALNLAIAALFAAFALNLLGAFEITLPARLLRRASTVGGGSRAGAALLMGGAFAVTSFTCTAPFVGTLLVLATQGSWRWPLLGLATYAAAFALPFFVLAVSPGLLARLPRSGPWMLTLRRALGVAELALAVKFLSNADLVLRWGVLTREAVLALWVIAAVVVALVMLLARGSARVPRVALGAAALAAGAWMATGLRGARLGELEAYLPPLPATVDAAGVVQAGRAADEELPWRHDDLDATLARARQSGRPVLVDFTGYTCTNCRWMEANMFPRPEVRALLAGFERARLFTDGVGERYARQQRWQAERFGTVALPYYAILAADGTPAATFLGMTRDPAEFARFLRRGLAATTTRTEAQ